MPDASDPLRLLDVAKSVEPDEVVSILRSLVAIPSVDGSLAECEIQRWCVNHLVDLGLVVDCWDIDVMAMGEDPEFPGMEVERSQAVGCVGVLGTTNVRPALALYGHTDVVPPGDLALWPDGNPFTLRVADGIARGRGACDMKGGVAAILAAVGAVRRSGLVLRHPASVHLVSAEEDGGLGAFATLRRGHTADACISAEPTSGDLIPANAGSLTFRLEVPGLSTHGSTRDRGVSAIEKFELIHAALRRLERERNAVKAPLFEHLDLPWPVSVGIVAAGDWASTVPDRLVADGRYGVSIDETIESAVARFEDAVAAACGLDPWLRDHPVQVSWPGGRFAPGRLAADDPLLEEVGDSVELVTRRRPSAYGGPYGSDLRHYAAAGIPTLQYGPGDVKHAHASDEQVIVDDLVTCARVYALMILRRCT